MDSSRKSTPTSPSGLHTYPHWQVHTPCSTAYKLFEQKYKAKNALVLVGADSIESPWHTLYIKYLDMCTVEPSNSVLRNLAQGRWSKPRDMYVWIFDAP